MFRTSMYSNSRSNKKEGEYLSFLHGSRNGVYQGKVLILQNDSAHATPGSLSHLTSRPSFMPFFLATLMIFLSSFPAHWTRILHVPEARTTCEARARNTTRHRVSKSLSESL